MSEPAENKMNTSQNIGALSAALAKAQGEIQHAALNAENPYFKSRYADLAAVWDCCRGPLAKNGLAVIQTTRPSDNGVTVITTLAHSSGEWISGEIFAKPTKNDPQGLGSCLTYLRRYSLAAIVGVAPSDDDGNAASRPVSAPEPESRALNAQTPIERLKKYLTNQNMADMLRDYLRAVPGKSGQYGLQPDQELDDLDPSLINYMLANWPKVMDAVDAWSDQIPGAEVADTQDAQPESTWKDAKLPFARKEMIHLKGKTLGELFAHEDKEVRNYIFGLVSKYEAKNWIDKDGKERAPGAESIAFETACKQWRAEHQKE